MARYHIKVNHPGQVEVGYDDGTVTIYTGHADQHDEFVIDCATDVHALDLIANLGMARTAKAVVEDAAMAGVYEDRRCSDCGQIVGHAPGCLHVELIESRVREMNVATRSIIRDAFSVPQSRSAS